MPRLAIGQAAEHMKSRHAALTLTAKIRPVGSINVEALQRQGHLASRHKLSAEARGQELLASFPRTTLEAWDCSGTGWVAQYLGATDSLRLIRVKGVVPGWVKTGPLPPRRVVITEEGDLILPGQTVIVTAEEATCMDQHCAEGSGVGHSHLTPDSISSN